MVALESSVLAQGLPIPANRQAAERMVGAVEQAVGPRGGESLATPQVVVEGLLAAVGREEGGLAAGGGVADPEQVGELAGRPLGRLLELAQLVDQQPELVAHLRLREARGGVLDHLRMYGSERIALG